MSGAPATTARPNVLVFVTDQQRADWLGCAGNEVLQTPNIDRIAATGVRFSRAYCANPVCMPSRATLMTGLLPSDHGVRANGINLSPHAVVLPEILRRAGYRTALVGKPHHSCWWTTPDRTPNIDRYDPALLPESRHLWDRRAVTRLPAPYFGFEESAFVGGHSASVFGEYLHWLEDHHPRAAADITGRASLRPSLHRESYYSPVPEELYYTEWITERTMQAIDRRSGEQPFFLWCSYPDPHQPFGPPAPWHSRYHAHDMPRPEAWDDARSLMPPHHQLDYYAHRARVAGGPVLADDRSLAQIAEMRALAYGMMGLVDQGVGRILDHLQRKGLFDNTIVVFLSDHGELMGDHGILFKGPYHYQGVLRVPLLMSWPGGGVRAGHAAGGLVSLLDLVPTLLELTGVPYPEEPFGDWRGPEAAHTAGERSMYDGVPRLPGKSLVPLLTGRCDAVQDAVLIENDEDYRGVSLRTLVTARAIYTRYRGNRHGELFDLAVDPVQRYNRWADPAAAALRGEMEGRLLDKIVDTQARHVRQVAVA